MQAFKIKEKIGLDKTFKIAPFRKHIRNTEPHKHKNYFEVIFLWKGDGVHLIDSTAYPIAAPAIFILKKNQIHAWDIVSEPEGFVLIIKDEFINHSKDTELKALFHLFWRIEHLPLQHDIQPIRNLFESLYHVYSQEQHFQDLIIEGLLKSILGTLLQEGLKQDIDNRYLDLYALFIDLISTTNGTNRNLSFYAEKLNIPSKVLNDICYKVAGTSAKKIVEAFTLSEAKRYLQFSNLTISEIAFRLQFNDPSYFVKFFKKHTNITPHQFRALS
jgi:AraC-like DNA-binding protein